MFRKFRAFTSSAPYDRWLRGEHIMKADTYQYLEIEHRTIRVSPARSLLFFRCKNPPDKNTENPLYILGV